MRKVLMVGYAGLLVVLAVLAAADVVTVDTLPWM